jgi:O-methyltransferase involved in polyketide biosynthesis
MDLTQVSRTAILLLICRAVEAKKNPAEFADPMSIRGLEGLLASVSEEDRDWITHQQRGYEGIHRLEAQAGVRRGQTFDRIANRFISEHPGCTVVNLACGFDTRYWRIDHKRCTFIDLDLPEVILLRKECFGNAMDYRTIGRSVLDTAWLDEVTNKGTTNFLLIAEGLFMYLPRQDVVNLFKVFSERLTRSQMIVEMVPEAWTRGLLKAIACLNFKVDWGLDISWQFGIKKPLDLETFSDGLKVLGVEKGSVGPIITVSINAEGK